MTKPAGQTVVQKIIARAASRERVNVGEYVEVTPDHSVCMELVWPLHLKNMERIGVDNVARPDHRCRSHSGLQRRWWLRLMSPTDSGDSRNQ